MACCIRCWKEADDGDPTRFRPLIVCSTCGNKRCPQATDHRHACTGSNESGQDGSAYGKLKVGQPIRFRKRSWAERLLSWPWRPWIALAAEPCAMQFVEHT